MNTEQYITALFIDAGWYEGREFNNHLENGQNINKNDAYVNAISIVKEFGGLTVGEVTQGREVSASDIVFRADVFDLNAELNCWQDIDTPLYAFASAHHDHMLLLVDTNNIFYIFTDPDVQLYKVGSFEELLKRVLLGIRYGVALQKRP